MHLPPVCDRPAVFFYCNEGQRQGGHRTAGQSLIVNAWTRCFTVDLSGTRPPNSKSDVLSTSEYAGENNERNKIQ